MPTGSVKWFDNRKGWGFLVLDEGGEVFVHQRDLEGHGFRALRPGQKVQFEIVEDERGPHARNVRPAD